jgi:hypothetical protein
VSALAGADWGPVHALIQYWDSEAFPLVPQYVSRASIPISDVLVSPAPSATPVSLDEQRAAAAAVYAAYPGQSIIVILLLPPAVHSVIYPGQPGFHDEITGAIGAPPFISLPGNTDYSHDPHTTQHEFAELITNPLLNGETQSAYWSIPPGSGGGEMGDICQASEPDGGGSLLLRSFQLLPLSRAPYNVFPLQSLQSNLSNNGSGYCVFSYETRSDTFVLGTDLNLYHSQDTTGTWSSWGHIGTSFLGSAPATVSHDPKYIDVYETSAAGDIWHIASQDGGATHTIWQNWGHPSTFTFSGRPAVTSWGSNRMDIYAVAQTGSSKALWHRSWDDGNDSGWLLVLTPSFTVSSPPGATSWGPANVEVALVDTAGNLQVGTSTDGQTITWLNEGNTTPALDVNAAPDIGSHDANSYDVYATDTSYLSPGLEHFYYSSTAIPTTGWNRLGNSYDADPVHGQKVKIGTGPTIVGRGDQRFMLEYTGQDGSVWQREYDFGFKSWTQILYSSGTFYDADVSAW